MKQKPTFLFSIIIPCYNQAHFLAECLESILKQQFQDWEAIVVNDGSPDHTNAVARKYAQQDTRIQLVEKENGGLSSARNFGIHHARGERFIFLDADDFLYPDCLMKIAEVAEASTNLDLIQYGYTYIKEDGKTILGTTYPQQKNSIIPEIFKGNLGPCHSISVSKELVKAAGAFDETLNSVEDWDFWTRTVKAGGRQKLIQQPLVYYRYSRNSMSRNPFVMYAALKTVIERGPKKDSRITVESPFNQDYTFDLQFVLDEVLIRSMGVGVMQGKIEATLDFFKKNASKKLLDYQPQDYEIMCSYMSFRYWYSPSDVKEVLTDIYPYFDSFFSLAGYSSAFKKRALYGIFKRHFFYQNKYRYGSTLGSVFNFVLQKINE